MDIILGVGLSVVVLTCILVAIFEYRIRQPDVLVLCESKGKISLRKSLVYPRHFSLPLKRTTCPIQMTVEASAAGNLEVRVKLVGSATPALGWLLLKFAISNYGSVSRSRIPAFNPIWLLSYLLFVLPR